MTINYLQTNLKLLEPDLYFCSLFAKRDRQPALWALFMFHHEIAKTRFVVTETQLGLIRLQWWRDEITKLYAGASPSDHPVLQGLSEAICDYALPQALFENLIYAREFDLEGVSPHGIDGLLSYSDLTTTPLNKLSLQICGEAQDENTVQEVSIFFTFINLFKRITSYKNSGFVLIDDKLEEEAKSFLSNHCEEKYHIKNAVLKAQNRLANIYFKQLRSVNFNPYDTRLHRPPLFKELRLLFGV